MTRKEQNNTEGVDKGKTKAVACVWERERETTVQKKSNHVLVKQTTTILVEKYNR